MSGFQIVEDAQIVLVPETLPEREMVEALKASPAFTLKGDPKLRTHIVVSYHQCQAG